MESTSLALATGHLYPDPCKQILRAVGVHQPCEMREHVRGTAGASGDRGCQGCPYSPFRCKDTLSSDRGSSTPRKRVRGISYFYFRNFVYDFFSAMNEDSPMIILLQVLNFLSLPPLTSHLSPLTLHVRPILTFGASVRNLSVPSARGD